MSWLFSQALVEEYLGENFLDGELSVQSSGKPIQQAYCAPDKMTDFLRVSRFGMTFKPLTDIPGEELSMSSVVVFHVRTLVQQEKAQELMEKEAECGEKWQGSFVKYDPDSSLWRTHQCSLLGGLDEFLETWPQWGLMRNGECWEQRTLEQTIRGTESGLSPNGIDKFHTPCTTGLDGGSNSRKALKKKLLPTPDASQRGPTKDYDPKAKSQLGRTLQSFAAKFPTPQASDYITKKTSASWKAKGGVNFSLSNPEIQAKWPTPRAADFKGATSAEAMSKAAARGFSPNLPEATAASVGGGKLNPMWVEWLMGWPLGWTDLKPLEMDKSHFVQQQHGES
jgi:DNA (cytosine-5)-methyltransferase 1